MKFATPRCPTCQQLAAGTLESISGRADLNVEEDGSADYSGHTEVFWDEQKTVMDDDGRVTLACPDGHEWQSSLEGGAS